MPARNWVPSLSWLRSFKYVGYGVLNDVRTRLPYYKSDFTDAWNYRVVPSTTYIFFTNLLPAIAFAQDMFDKTENSYGVNEVLMSSAFAGVAFGLFSGQPLCIVGVTGPISIFSYTVYELIGPRGTPYFPFMCWIYLWSMIFHFILAFTNSVSFLKIISSYSCDVFGFFICVVYIQKAIQLLNGQFHHVDLASGYASVMIALLMVACGVGSHIFGSQLHYFNPVVRKIFVDYGVPASVILISPDLFTLVDFWRKQNSQDYPLPKSFAPTLSGRKQDPTAWFIHFWPSEKYQRGRCVSCCSICYFAHVSLLALTTMFRH
ncbi:hypothetical protein PGUG_02793 [Meyerozyma guilliermondii ATCC 6260]|uniref:Bicarbonate transporter-like transmembrane domain-containing protein n=1 Tax=Meyerozyma guilliermondii (strain ATCC 6260 / CBS 566 / DSM 6381 / JCM 1539 / NBRC 10279 / NRRL Y-324) TaxID=294746 RepID=A5DHP2_PICGU|nr:uncharacterized protein PGUG_02793 [Meyerozyma guilliermondii ATCC 6260]EDK38695.2 hypothetical protein PGUG_02793 [Meyerozyma guilliermondii ATCC 6260]